MRSRPRITELMESPRDGQISKPSLKSKMKNSSCMTAIIINQISSSQAISTLFAQSIPIWTLRKVRSEAKNHRLECLSCSSINLATSWKCLGQGGSVRVKFSRHLAHSMTIKVGVRKEWVELWGRLESYFISRMSWEKYRILAYSRVIVGTLIFDSHFHKTKHLLTYLKFK